MLVGGLISALWLAVEVGRQLPAADEIGTLGIMANATVIFDAFDQPAFTLFRERRLSIPLHEISSHLTGAVLAVEDRRFYDHRGFDLIRMAGAAVFDVQAGRLAQGGSTITQQLARVSLLSRERTFRRKIAEIITAVQIERAYPKDRILEFYLNKVYFGEGFYGVEAPRPRVSWEACVRPYTGRSRAAGRPDPGSECLFACRPSRRGPDAP